MMPATCCSSTAGLADSLFVFGRGGRSGGASGSGEKVGAGPAWVRHAHSAWASALCVPHRDGTAVPDLRHDHLVCVVDARADRPFLASQSRGVPVCPADRSAFSLVGLECGRERAGRFPDACRAPLAGLLFAAVALRPRVLVDSIDRFAQRSGRAGGQASRRWPGRLACELPKEGGGKRMTPRSLAHGAVRRRHSRGEREPDRDQRVATLGRWPISSSRSIPRSSRKGPRSRRRRSSFCVT